MSDIPSDKIDTLTGGVVRPFPVTRKSPNVLYLGDMIGENRVTGFAYNGGIQLVEFNDRRWWSFDQVNRLILKMWLEHLTNGT